MTEAELKDYIRKIDAAAGKIRFAMAIAVKGVGDDSSNACFRLGSHIAEINIACDTFIHQLGEEFAKPGKAYVPSGQRPDSEGFKA